MQDRKREALRRTVRLQARSGDLSVMLFDPESVDLLELTRRLTRRLEQAPRAPGYFEGKTQLRDWVLEELPCSQLQAERVVDTLVSQGFLEFSNPSAPRAAPSELGWWRVGHRLH